MNEDRDLKYEATLSGYVGNQLRKLRCHRSITPSALSARLNISKPQFSYYETGKTLIPTQRIVQLSKILRCEAGYFFPPILSDESWEIVRYMTDRDMALIEKNGNRRRSDD